MSEVQERPLVTFALLAYNQERFIQEAVESALAQDYSPLEIILSDDFSSDKTFEIIKKISSSYEGKNNIVIRENSKNIGLAGHLNQIISMARGKLLVVAAGDDVSTSNRVSEIVKHWVVHDLKAISIFSAMREIDVNSVPTGKIYKSSRDWGATTAVNMLERNLGVFGAAHAWSSAVTASFAPLHSEVVNEDVAIPFRAALMDGIVYIDKELVDYRANIGLASNYGSGIFPGRSTRRSVAMLRRPYLIYVQKCADLKERKPRSEMMVLAKSRRADHLFRYWLAKKGRFTWVRTIFFVRRCRFLWIAKELALSIYHLK